ncbi:tRNA (guanine-N(7)-)-methyltransferase non-catalytic subunit trm82 [Microbotryomycetes sp. JL221]|nr:tRNA (guanine-N(7)-)-methyltransferase non-catalytic subunit trm82 [Microbotryomycetes sp. JL221]
MAMSISAALYGYQHGSNYLTPSLSSNWISKFKLKGECTRHTGTVRHLVSFTVDNDVYLASTGEDKKLHVYLLPKLELIHEYELNKRATAMTIDDDGKVVVADKFGDVWLYRYLFERRLPRMSQLTKPILGHVSMLNAVTLVPKDEAHNVPTPLIVTADLDEHIRVSRYPRGHVIDKYLWGSTKFVSALAHIPGNDEYPQPLILAAGGDTTLKVFGLDDGTLLKEFDVDKYLRPYIAVKPPRPVKKKNNFGNKSKGKAKAQNGHEHDEDAAEDEHDNEDDDAESDAAQKDDRVLAITKIVPFGKRDSSKAKSGVLVTAAGCTAILYIPNSELGISIAEDRHTTSLVDVGFPVLDIFHTNPTVTSRFWITYDIGAKRKEAYTIRQIHYSSSGRALMLDPASYSVEGILTEHNKLVKSNTPYPLATLYPILAMMQNAAAEREREQVAEAKEAIDDDEAADGAADRPTRNNKRKAEDSPGPDTFGRTGKRAAARAETQRRLQEQRDKKSVTASQ